MKKVLALVVAFALCFTAFAGCFATSAATLDNFAVSSVEVAADAQAAAVTVSGTYTGKAVQLLTVTLPEGVALASVAGANELTDTQDGDYIVTGNVVKFLTIPKDAFTYTLNVTFAANASETDVVTHTVVANVEYALYEAETPAIEYAEAEGTITVAKKAPAHVHAAAADAEWQKDADNHWKVCAEHADVVLDQAAHVPADAIEKDGYSIVLCSVCGYEISKVAVEPEHVCTWGELQYRVDGADYANKVYGTCVTYQECTDLECDEIKIIEEVANVKFGHAPRYESDLTLMFRIDNVALDNYTNTSDYSDIDAVVTKDLYEKVTNNKLAPAVDNLKLEKYNDTRQQVVYGGIRAMEMQSNINCSIYGINDEGYRVLIACEDYTMVDYIKAIYDLRINATSAKQKAERALVVDMAIYGAAAQVQFKYNTENLADKDIDKTYASKEIQLNEFTSTGPVATTGVTWNRAPEYENKVLMNLRFQKSQAPEGSYIIVDYYTIKNKQLTAEQVRFDKFQDYDTNRYQITFEEILAPTIPQKFTATLYAADGTFIGSHEYSLEAYAYTITNGNYSAAEKKLVNAMINYGRMSYTYLTTN